MINITNYLIQVVLDSGWGPETGQMFDSDDPMIQQMNIIQNYIKQARYVMELFMITEFNLFLM